MLRKVALSILAGLLFSSLAAAQNINEIMRMFGGVMQNAIAQAAYSEWRKRPNSELICVDQYLRQRGSSLETIVRQGITPSDDRISSARAACIAAANNMAAVSSPTFDCSRVTYPDEQAICSNAELAQLDRDVVANYEIIRQKFGDLYARRINAPLFQARRACGSYVSCIKEL